MVTITNGIKTFRVTAGAVEVYKSMGFHVASDEELDERQQVDNEHYHNDGESEKSTKGRKEKDEVSVEDVEDNSDMNKEDTGFIEELLEKPLSQWSSDEVKEFVKIKDIDTSGAEKLSQVRSIIKAYLEEQNKNM